MSRSGGSSGERIAGIDLSVLGFPLDPPFRAAVALIDSVTFVLAEVRTTGGAVGIGYGFAFLPEDAAAIRAIAEPLGALLVGAAPEASEALWRRMWNRLVFLGQGGAGISALSVLDMALWDLRGKLAGLSLSHLLGQAQERVPVYGSGGSMATPIAALAAEMAAHAQAGYPAVKLKIGHADLAEDIARLRAVRDAIGEGPRIIVDANQQWTPRQAIAAAPRLAEFGIWWLEEPVPAARIEACAEVARGVPFSVATGETNFTPDEFSRLMEARAADILMPNLQRVGGITAWRKVAAAAELRGVSIASHVYPEIGVHLMASVPHGLTLEVIPWWPRFFNEAVRIEGGCAIPSEAPGFGISLDQESVKRHRIA